MLAAAVPAVRFIVKRPVRDELRARPAFLLAALLVLAAILVAIVWAWQHSDLTRRSMVAIAAAVAVVAAIRARPDYGRSRGLPPGSLGFASSLDAITDEEFYSRAARRWGPVFKMSQFHRPVVCVTDLPRGLELMETSGDALLQTAWGFNPLVPGGYVEFMDGAPHARMRELLRTGFTDAVLSGCRPDIQEIVRQSLDSLAARSTPGEVDPYSYLDAIAFATVMRMVLGVPATTKASEWAGLFNELDQQLDSVLPPPDRVRVAYQRIATKVRELAEARHASTTCAKPSVLSAIVRAEPSLIDDPAVVGNVVMLVINGRGILRTFLRWLLKDALSDERWMSELRNAAADSAKGERRVDELATWMVHESLRLHGSPYVYRVIARELRLGQYRLPRGWLLRLCVREAHGSPESFADPRRYNPHRFADGGHSAAALCPFGRGAHACLGDQLVLDVGKTLVTELSLRFDAQIVNDGGPAKGHNRHWQFWQPGRGFQVRVAPRVE